MFGPVARAKEARAIFYFILFEVLLIVVHLKKFFLFQLKYLTSSTAAVYLEYVQRNLPEGVAMEVKKVSFHLTLLTVMQIPVTTEVFRKDWENGCNLIGKFSEVLHGKEAVLLGSATRWHFKSESCLKPG